MSMITVTSERAGTSSWTDLDGVQYSIPRLLLLYSALSSLLARDLSIQNLDAGACSPSIRARQLPNCRFSPRNQSRLLATSATWIVRSACLPLLLRPDRMTCVPPRGSRARVQHRRLNEGGPGKLSQDNRETIPAPLLTLLSSSRWRCYGSSAGPSASLR